MLIREANVEDIPDLCKLLDYLFEQEEEFKPDNNIQRIGLQKILEDSEKGIILILKNNGETIGMVNLLFTISTALGGKVALLEDMIVIPSERGKGYGSELLKTAIEYASDRKCKRITLLTDDANEKAQKFYNHHGFVHSPMRPMRYVYS